MASSRKRGRQAEAVEDPSAAGGSSIPASQVQDEDLQRMTQLARQYEEELEDLAQGNAGKNVSEEEMDGLASEIIRYILFRNYARNGRPISNSDLTELVSKKYHGTRKGISAHAIKLAQAKLLDIFGMELKVVYRAAASAKGPGKSKSTGSERGTQWYVVRSAIPADLRLRLVDLPMEKDTSNALAVMILACIHLSGGEILEPELWRMLEALGLQPNTPHDVFGKPCDRLSDMEAIRYVTKEKATTADGDSTFKYKIAENALDEIGLEGIQDFVKEITGCDDD